MSVKRAPGPCRTIDEAVAANPFGRASAAKRGRNPAFPYVPIVDFGEQEIGIHRTRTEQIRGKAFPDREAAVRYAQRVIEARREHFRQQLLNPRFGPLRAQWGVADACALAKARSQ